MLLIFNWHRPYHAFMADKSLSARKSSGQPSIPFPYPPYHPIPSISPYLAISRHISPYLAISRLVVGAESMSPSGTARFISTTSTHRALPCRSRWHNQHKSDKAKRCKKDRKILQIMATRLEVAAFCAFDSLGHRTSFASPASLR